MPVKCDRWHSPRARVLKGIRVPRLRKPRNGRKALSSAEISLGGVYRYLIKRITEEPPMFIGGPIGLMIADG